TSTARRQSLSAGLPAGGPDPAVAPAAARIARGESSLAVAHDEGRGPAADQLTSPDAGRRTGSSRPRGVERGPATRPSRATSAGPGAVRPRRPRPPARRSAGRTDPDTRRPRAG